VLATPAATVLVGDSDSPSSALSLSRLPFCAAGPATGLGCEDVVEAGAFDTGASVMPISCWILLMLFIFVCAAAAAAVSAGGAAAAASGALSLRTGAVAAVVNAIVRFELDTDAREWCAGEGEAPREEAFELRRSVETTVVAAVETVAVAVEAVEALGSSSSQSRSLSGEDERDSVSAPVPMGLWLCVLDTPRAAAVDTSVKGAPPGGTDGAAAVSAMSSVPALLVLLLLLLGALGVRLRVPLLATGGISSEDALTPAAPDPSAAAAALAAASIVGEARRSNKMLVETVDNDEGKGASSAVVPRRARVCG